MAVDLAGRRISIVGGAGFIGHNLALALAARGAEVSIVDALEVNNLVALLSDRSSPNRNLYMAFVEERLQLLDDAHIEVRVQDARDYHMLCRALAELDPQTIVHLAAVSHAGWANKNPFSTFDHSLRTLENSLDYARGSKLDHFVYFSSSMVYGDFPAASVTEDTPCNPKGIYGALKLSGEHMVVAYQQVYDLPFTIVRPSALYGERCISRRVGQVFIERALRGEPLTVSGNGEERLDFTYVADLVEGTSLVLARESSRNEIFNITYGSSRPVADLVEIIRTRVPDLTVTYEPADRLMPSRGTLDVSKARDRLGYEPQFPIDVGFRQYLSWYERLREERPDIFKA